MTSGATLDARSKVWLVFSASGYYDPGREPLLVTTNKKLAKAAKKSGDYEVISYKVTDDPKALENTTVYVAVREYNLVQHAWEDELRVEVRGMPRYSPLFEILPASFSVEGRIVTQSTDRLEALEMAAADYERLKGEPWRDIRPLPRTISEIPIEERY